MTIVIAIGSLVIVTIWKKLPEPLVVLAAAYRHAEAGDLTANCRGGTAHVAKLIQQLGVER